MLQAASVPAPPQTPQAPRVDGNAIGQAVREAISGSFSGIRAELQKELEGARAERASIMERLDASPSRRVRSDLQSQLDVVNARIEKLQTGVNALDSRITTTDGPRIATTAPPTPPAMPQDFGDNFNPAPMVISIMAILFIGFPLALTYARLMWRRATNTTPPSVTADTARRFDRLEQSVDAIAIEIERISENQRYLTKVLSEPKPESLKA